MKIDCRTCGRKELAVVEGRLVRHRERMLGFLFGRLCPNSGRDLRPVRAVRGSYIGPGRKTLHIVLSCRHELTFEYDGNLPLAFELPCGWCLAQGVVAFSS